MDAPPPYMAPRKKSNTGLIVGIVIAAVVVCCIGPIVLFLGGGYFLFNKGKEIAQCTYAFRDLRDGLRMYAADHGGKLPPADKWQDEVTSYYQKAMSQSNVKDREVIGSMPASGLWGCNDGSGGKTGIAYNDDIAGQDLSKLETSTEVILFEVEKATQNAHEKYVKRTTGGPKILGAPRGWFVIRMSGEPSLITPRGEKSGFSASPGND